MLEERKVILFTGDVSDFELLDGKRLVELPVEALHKNFQNFMVSFSDILRGVELPATGFALKTLSVALAIDAKGQVGFLGTGGEIGGAATLTLTFERQ